jgi:hypothetical protein
MTGVDRRQNGPCAAHAGLACAGLELAATAVQVDRDSESFYSPIRSAKSSKGKRKTSRAREWLTSNHNHEPRSTLRATNNLFEKENTL